MMSDEKTDPETEVAEAKGVPASARPQGSPKAAPKADQKPTVSVADRAMKAPFVRLEVGDVHDGGIVRAVLRTEDKQLVQVGSADSPWIEV